MGYINLFGEGISQDNDGSGATLDGGYDAGASAFLIGRLDFDVVGAADSTTDIEFSQIIVVDGDADIGGAAALGRVTVAGGGDPPKVPEPTTAGLLAIGLAGFVARRRR